MQLRQYLSGEAVKATENLGYSALAYQAAKERLERKYGGKQHQIAIYMEEVDNFRPIQYDNHKDIETFADLLDIVVVNLKDAGRVEELGDGFPVYKITEEDNRIQALKNSINSISQGVILSLSFQLPL